MTTAAEPYVDVHATAPQPHTLDQSRWPALAAAGIVLFAVGVTTFWPLGALGVVMIAGAIVGVALEVNPRPVHARGELAPEPRPPEQGAGKRLWLALGISLSSFMVMAAILRAYVAHGLLLPETWPEVARDLATPAAFAATFLLIASFGAAAAGVLALRRGRRTLALGLQLGGLALAFAFIAALAFEWQRLWSAGFLPNIFPAASGYYALTGYHALTVLGTTVLFGIYSWHGFARRLHGKESDSLVAGLAYWAFVTGAWLVTFLVIHLRLVVWEGRSLL